MSIRLPEILIGGFFFKCCLYITNSKTVDIRMIIGIIGKLKDKILLIGNFCNWITKLAKPIIMTLVEKIVLK